MFFPCNDAIIWFLKHLDQVATTIVRKLNIQIASLRSKDIRFVYPILEPIISLNEPFFREFSRDHKYFEEMMEYWCCDEEIKLKQGEWLIPI